MSNFNKRLIEDKLGIDLKHASKNDLIKLIVAGQIKMAEGEARVYKVNIFKYIWKYIKIKYLSRG